MCILTLDATDTPYDRHLVHCFPADVTQEVFLLGSCLPDIRHKAGAAGVMGS